MFNRRSVGRILRLASVYVYLSTHTYDISKPIVKISPNFLHTLSVTMAWSFSDDCAIRYVLPVLWMTLRFHIMGPMGQAQAQRYVSTSSPGGGTGGKVCRLQLHLVNRLNRLKPVIKTLVYKLFL